MRIRIVTEGASSGIWNAPSVTSLLATRHLPRFTGEEKGLATMSAVGRKTNSPARRSLQKPARQADTTSSVRETAAYSS